MPIRKVSNRGGNVIGHFPSIKMKRMVAFESLIERDSLYLLDYELGIESLKREYRVLSRSTPHLLKSLHAARASGTQPRLLSQVLNADLLILDDFGLHPLTPQAAQDLYEIISERYERGSMAITSNRAFEEWAEVFNNDLLASAAAERRFSASSQPCPLTKSRRNQPLS